MGYLKAFLAAIGGLFTWLNKRSDLANSPEMKKNRAAQQEQQEKDEIARLTRVAMNDPDPRKRLEAAERLRQMDSE